MILFISVTRLPRGSKAAGCDSVFSAPVRGLRNLSGYPTSSHRGARGPEPRSPHSSLAHSVLSGLTLYKYRAAALSCQSTYSKQTTTIKNDVSGSFGGCRRLAFGPGLRALSKLRAPAPEWPGARRFCCSHTLSSFVVREGSSGAKRCINAPQIRAS